MTRNQRLAYQSRMDELLIDPWNEGKNEGKNKDGRIWERLQASAQPGLDASGQPVLEMGIGDDLARVGISRANILSISESPEFAARLMEARLRQELRPAIARKTSHSDVEKDLALFQKLLALQPRDIAVRDSLQ